MADQATRARQFAELHRKGEPVIIFNAWDGGSARVIANAGAKAIATGDHPVGYSRGFSDANFDDFSFDSYLQTIADIARVLDDLGGSLPFSVDISNGDGLDESGLQERTSILLSHGVIGINFEDRLPDSSDVQPVEEQCKRIAAIRAAADQAGIPLFINARSDIFALRKAEHADLLDEAIARATAYQQAGASGFFAPGLGDVQLVRQLCDAVSLPVNIIRLPNAPSAKELANAGVSRISYGPVPQMRMSEWLKGQAETALRGDD